MIVPKVTANLMTKSGFLHTYFLNSILLPFIKVESQIHYLQQNCLGENMKGYWSKNCNFGSEMEKISSSILLCILRELAEGGSVAVAVCVSAM